MMAPLVVLKSVRQARRHRHACTARPKQCEPVEFVWNQGRRKRTPIRVLGRFGDFAGFLSQTRTFVVATRHSRMYGSLPAENTDSPLLANATAMGGFSQVNFCSSRPVCASQTRTEWSTADFEARAHVILGTSAGHDKHAVRRKSGQHARPMSLQPARLRSPHLPHTNDTVLRIIPEAVSLGDAHVRRQGPAAERRNLHMPDVESRQANSRIS